jgi:hypothetical protein
VVEPVVQSTKFEFAINLQTARLLVIEVPHIEVDATAILPPRA